MRRELELASWIGRRGVTEGYIGREVWIEDEGALAGTSAELLGGWPSNTIASFNTILTRASHRDLNVLRVGDLIPMNARRDT